MGKSTEAKIFYKVSKRSCFITVLHIYNLSNVNKKIKSKYYQKKFTKVDV